MRIDLHARGFELTNHTRDFVQSRLLSTLGQFRGHIGSVAVNLATSNGRSRPDTSVCDIVVNVHPSGEVRRRAEHEWMHVAIDRAASGIDTDVEREFLRTASQRATSPVVGDRAPYNRMPRYRRNVRELMENNSRPIRVRERWQPPRTEEGRVGP